MRVHPLRRAGRALLLLPLLLPVPAPSLASEGFPPDTTIARLLGERVRAGRNPGIVVGLRDARGTRVLAAGAVGDSGSAAPDGDTLFEIGSITKVFTTSLLAEMVGRGEVRLDDPIGKHLPDSVRAPARDGKGITLLDLATQTSGLPRLPTNFPATDPSNPYADYSVRQLHEFLSGYTLTRGIGEKYEYSNLGVGLLGHLLARRAGKDYETLLRERILAPLGMDDTAIALSGPLRRRLAEGRDAMGNPGRPWDLPALAGAGALRSTANDMLRFLGANLDSGASALAPALASTHAERVPTGAPDLSVGLAWHIFRKFGRTILWHNGETGGYHAFAGFDPERGLGVVVLTNAAVSIDDLALHLLAAEFPLATPGARKVHTEIAVEPEVLDDYPGEYELAPGFLITVTREGDALFIQATGQSKVPVYPEAADAFFLKVVEAQVTFVRGADGTVVELVLHQGGRDTPGRRLP